MTGLDPVAPGVWALAIPMPDARLATSNAYLLRDDAGGLHVVDPGWESEEGWRILHDAAVELAGSIARVETVTITHLHPDHAGLALRLQRASGAAVRLHARETESRRAQEEAARSATRESAAARLDSWGVPADRRADLLDLAAAATRLTSWSGVEATPLADGDVLEAPGLRLTTLLTPGHTPGSICLRDDDHELLLTGDHLLPELVSGLGLGGDLDTNPLADFLDGVERLQPYGGDLALPGHGPRFRDPAARARFAAEHHLRRTREVAAELARDPDRPTWEIASRLTWTAGWDGLAGAYLFSALRQTDMHRDFIAARPDRLDRVG